MGTPPLDAAGCVVPHDDPDIPDDAYVVRYVPSGDLRPSEEGGRRLSSAVFSASSKRRDSYQGMSVDILEALVDVGVQPKDRANPIHEAIVKLRVGALRDLGLLIGSDPGKNNDPFHAEVWGVKKSIRRRILEISEWITKPDDVT